MPITSSSAMTTITAATTAPASFSAFISTFQTAQMALISVARDGATGQASLSRKGVGPKEAKNIPGVLQCYVTYDTLGCDGILLTGLGGWVGPIWKVVIQ
jgi:hypothetical protein